MTIPSDDIRRVAGTYIEDDKGEKPPLIAWIQIECRNGCFKKAIEEAVKSQSESLRSDLVIVESAELQKIKLRVPGRVLDHESSSSFQTDVHFELDPLTQKMTRL